MAEQKRSDESNKREPNDTPDAELPVHPARGEAIHDAYQDKLADIVGAKEDRKTRARMQANRSAWFGFGMFGLIGWSVSVPAVVCIAIGVWIDSRWPSQYSWTLMMLFIGVILGCLNAWYWLSRERSNLER